jgi:hypothetical protein
MSAGLGPKKCFKFELFWLNLDGIDDAIKEGWKCGKEVTNPFLRLDSSFRNLAAHL